MNATALAMVLAGAVCHAIWNVIAKKTSGGPGFVWLYGAVSLLAAVPPGIWTAWNHGQHFDAIMWLAALTSGLVHVLYSIVLQKSYKVGDFSTVYPIARGTGPLLTVLIAVFLLGEHPSAIGWMGISGILLGIFVSSGRLMRSEGIDIRRRRLGLIWGLFTGAFIAAYTVIDGWSIRSLGMNPILFYCVGLVFRTLLLAPLAASSGRALISQWKAQWRHVIAVGLLSPAAYLLILFALQSAPLTYVAPIREISMLVGTILGGRLLKEAIHTPQIVGVFLMLLGVTALAVA